MVGFSPHSPLSGKTNFLLRQFLFAGAGLRSGEPCCILRRRCRVGLVTPLNSRLACKLAFPHLPVTKNLFFISYLWRVIKHTHTKKANTCGPSGDLKNLSPTPRAKTIAADPALPQRGSGSRGTWRFWGPLLFAGLFSFKVKGPDAFRPLMGLHCLAPHHWHLKR